jgi:hypothetical protein
LDAFKALELPQACRARHGVASSTGAEQQQRAVEATGADGGGRGESIFAKKKKKKKSSEKVELSKRSSIILHFPNRKEEKSLNLSTTKRTAKRRL